MMILQSVLLGIITATSFGSISGTLHHSVVTYLGGINLRRRINIDELV